MASRIIAPGWWTNLKVFECGHECNPQNPCRYHTKRDRYLLMYITEGTVRILKNNQSFELSKGDLFTVMPEESATAHWNSDAPFEHIWISFSCDICPDFLLHSVIRRPPVKPIFLTIRDHIADHSFEGRLFALIYDLFWQLSQSEMLLDGCNRSYASYAKNYLDVNFTSQIKIQDVADQLHIDRRYLTALFHREYDVPPQAYLMNLRLNKAKEFLRLGHSVTESASMAGFTDLPNFSRQYRSKFGISPGSERTLNPENAP